MSMTTEALIFDAVRTPRGKGKKDGSLHTVKPIDLVVGLMHALEERNGADIKNYIDDVVLGCVTPVGDQGMDIAKTAAIAAGWSEMTAGGAAESLLRLWSGSRVNMGAMKIRSGFEDLVVVGGVESMSRCVMGSDGGAWPMDPATNLGTGFVPQGIGADLIATIEGFTRTDVDTFAVQSNQRAAKARAEGWFKNPWCR
jgi:acetyl-CoA C-acetyltransferase